MSQMTDEQKIVFFDKISKAIKNGQSDAETIGTLAIREYNKLFFSDDKMKIIRDVLNSYSKDND